MSVSTELIRNLAKENRLWGADLIRGKLLKLDIQACKRTIQKYLPKARITPTPSQTWSTFMKNHARDILACDFTVVYDWSFHAWYVFVVMELKSRRIIHIMPTQQGLAASSRCQLYELRCKYR